MNCTSLYIAPYALDKAVTVQCRVGLSIIELDHWWIELWQDYGVVLMAGNDNLRRVKEKKSFK